MYVLGRGISIHTGGNRVVARARRRLNSIYPELYLRAARITIYRMPECAQRRHLSAPAAVARSWIEQLFNNYLVLAAQNTAAVYTSNFGRQMDFHVNGSVHCVT